MTKIINEITPEHLAKLDQIDRNCLEMHIPTPPKTFINMRVSDKDGNPLLDYSMPSRSWVRNAYNGLAALFLGGKSANYPSESSYGAGSLRLTSIGNSLSTMSVIPIWWMDGMTGAAANTNYGIVAGTGTTAESFGHYKLATLIATGNSSGQLAYQAMSSPAPSYDSGTKKWTCAVVRVLNNNSGASISVAEVGIYVQGNAFSSNAYHMLCRDLLAEAVVVPNGGQLTVTYTIEMTFPA